MTGEWELWSGVGKDHTLRLKLNYFLYFYSKYLYVLNSLDRRYNVIEPGSKST